MTVLKIGSSVAKKKTEDPRSEQRRFCTVVQNAEKEERSAKMHFKHRHCVSLNTAEAVCF